MPGERRSGRGLAVCASRRFAVGVCALVGLLGACSPSLAGGPAAATRAMSVTGKGFRYQPIGHIPPPVVKPPNDPLFPYQWNLRTIQVAGAWSVSRGRGVMVAVLDTGVAYENRGRYRRAPDLAGTRLVAGWDFVDGDAHPDDVPPRDGRRTHGTQIAGIIAETANNGIGGAGVAPDTSIMPIRVLRPDLSGSARTIAMGLRFAADHGANVANLSIAGLASSPVLKDAIQYAYSRGVTLVAAAGNDGQSSISFPGAYPNVVSVGAVAQDLARASYSNYGRALDLVAPGGAGQDIDSGYGPADGVVAQTLKGGPSEFCYCFTASTSAAAAEVSGVAAVLIGSGRATTPAEVRRALLAGARPLGPGGWNPQYGAGLVQAWGALAAAGPLPRSMMTSTGSSVSSWSDWLTLTLGGAVALVAGLLCITHRRRRRVA